MSFLSVLDWIYPPRCIFCNNIIPLSKYSGYNVCNNCNENIPFMKRPICIKCGRTTTDNNICVECAKTTHIYEKGWVALEYNEMAKEAIHKFKYENYPLYSKTLAEIMYKYIYSKEFLNYNFDLIVPVPIHKNKLKQRGYNQAELLAKELSKKLNIPYENIITRIKDTKPQSSLSPKERTNNLKDAFEIVHNRKVYNKNILIIDDVYTTGSTIDACVNSIIDIDTNNIVYYYILSSPIKHVY